MSDLTPEFVEDRIDEFAQAYWERLKLVIESSAFDGGVADPSEIVEEIGWWVELTLAGNLKDALIGGSNNA
jgi:hypothetical protein